MDRALKQRLVGASVLIALAVIVLPMLLGGRPEGTVQEPRKIEIPPQPPDLSFETRRYPIGEQKVDDAEPVRQADSTVSKLPVPSPGGNQQPEPAGAGPARDETTAAPSPADTVPVDSGSAGEQVKPPAIAPQDRPVTPGRYVVQVASFGAADNANRLSESLQRKGYSVLVDTVASDVGTLSRVRIGPFDTEAQANVAVDELKAQISGIKPRVMDLQPEQATQVSSPVDPLIRWVVQAGSFADARNAENLVARLRLEGMSAYQETVSSGPNTIYRVRIGPFLERDEAIRIDQQVEERLGLDGVVMSAD